MEFGKIFIYQNRQRMIEKKLSLANIFESEKQLRRQHT